MRNINSDLWADEFVINLSPIERLLWIGIIITCADDQGRFPKNLITIRIKIFPNDQVTPDQIDKTLNKFAKEKKVIIYEANGKTIVQISNWWMHQRASEWMSKSQLPPPEGWVDFYRYHGKGNEIIKSQKWEDRHNMTLGSNYVEPTYALRSREGDVNCDDDSDSDDENLRKSYCTFSN
jgi:hypothetical protein